MEAEEKGRREELRTWIERLARERDELRVKANLAKADLRDEWNELEGKWSSLRARMAGAADEAGQGAGDVAAAARLLAEEVQKSLARIRDRL